VATIHTQPSRPGSIPVLLEPMPTTQRHRPKFSKELQDLAQQFADRPVKADLLVPGTKGRMNLKHVLLGSTVEGLLREIPCSVLTAKPRKDTAVGLPENPEKAP
jgi:nucleotide-binding universal stress UspA family protein